MSDVDEQQKATREAREALIGKSIAGRYVLRGLVGHGGMGAVYEAEHLGLDKRVAIKFIDPEFATEERVVARFAREARAMSAVDTPHIVTVFDAGSEDGRPYLVMELLRGEDLGQRLRRERRIPVSVALHIVAQVLKGLSKAHAAGIIHRDLKPDNVFLIRTETDAQFAKIVDFGVSKIERPRDRTSPLALTGRGTILGTPFYMCPEQAQAMSDIDVRADIYSVGAILFECLTGRPPHTGETYEQIILSICMRDAPDVRAVDPSLSPQVAAFVARALARDRTERFASAQRMLAALHEIAPEERARVPLDPGALATLLSAGVNVEAPAPGSAPRRPPSVPVVSVATAPSKGARVPPPSSHDARARGGRYSLLSVVLTAVFAMAVGVAVMLGAITLLAKRSSGDPPPPTPPSSSTPKALPPPVIDAPAPSEAPAVPSAAPSGAPPKTPPHPPRKGGGAKPASSKPLDISRDLP